MRTPLCLPFFCAITLSDGLNNPLFSLCGQDNETNLDLHEPTIWGYDDMIKFRLDRGADVAELDRHGNTPLMVAVHTGHLKICNLLLGHMTVRWERV